MDKLNKNVQKPAEIGESSKDKFNYKNGEAFVQNPDQNNQIHKASLGPNTKR